MRTNSKLIKKDIKNCKEIIATIIEFLIKGEQANQSEIFDVFCELNFLNEFILLSNLDDYEIDLSIIDSFSVLLINLSSITSIYYIFSNNFINQIISKDYSQYDENFLSFYINFIKSLTLRIDNQTIEFFFRSNVNSFPLVQCALRFYNFHESMIRTCVRTIILTVLKIDYDKIQDYFTQLPTVEYFIFIVLQLKDMILKLDEHLLNNNQSGISDLTGDILDELLFMNDLFNLHLSKINYVIMNTLFSYLILPVLCQAFVTKSKPEVSINLSIFIIILFIDNIKDECFINVLFTILFSDRRSHDMIEYLNPPKGNKNYCPDWNNQMALKVTFLDFVTNNYSEGFLMSLLFENNIIYNSSQSFTEIKEINKKIKEKSKNNQPIQLSEIKSIVDSGISPSDMEVMKDYHKSVCLGVGLSVGLYSDNKKKTDKFETCFMCEMLKYYQLAKLQYVDKSHLLFPNEIKNNIFNYLDSKDDTLILLVNIMIFFSMEKNIAQFLVSESKLFNYNRKDLSGGNDLLNLNGIFSSNTPTRENNNNAAHISFKSFTFDNQHFTKFYSYSNEPDYILIEKLLKLLVINPPLRKITSELVLLNLNHLLISNSSQSLQVILTKQIDFLFRQIYIRTISRINDLIKASQRIREKGYELFKEEWLCYTSNTTPLSQLISLLEKPYFLIPNNLDESIDDYPSELKAQTSDLEILRYYLLIYMKMHDLCLIINNQVKTKTFIKKKFPLQINEFEFELDQSYNITSLNEENNIVLEAKLKTETMTEYIDIVIVVYFSYLYFGWYDESKDFAVIKYKNYLGNVSLKGDSDESNLIQVHLKDEQDPKFTIILIEEEMTQEFILNIQEWTMTVINNDKTKFCWYFQEKELKENE